MPAYCQKLADILTQYPTLAGDVCSAAIYSAIHRKGTVLFNTLVSPRVIQFLDAKHVAKMQGQVFSYMEGDFFEATFRKNGETALAMIYQLRPDLRPSNPFSSYTYS